MFLSAEPSLQPRNLLLKLENDKGSEVLKTESID